MRRPASILALTAVLAGLALTACGAAADVVAREPSSFANAPLNFDPALLVLQVGTVCSGACAYLGLMALPEVVLYGDGRVVRTRRSLPDPRLVLTTGQVPVTRVRDLVALAVASGLTGGGRSALEVPRAGSDGNGDVFTARLDDEVTTFDTPLAYDIRLDPGSADLGRRRALRDLADALRSLAAGAPYAVDRVVLRSEPRSYDQPDAVVWPGPRLADLPADGNGRCAVLTGEPGRAALDAVPQDTFPTVYREDGAQLQVQARPALPNENTCAEVAETVRTSTGG